MAPTAGNAVFVDTNILVYATFPGAPFHAVARARLNELDANGAVLWTSRRNEKNGNRSGTDLEFTAPLHSGLSGNWSGPTGKDHSRTPRSVVTRLAPLAAEFLPGGKGRRSGSNAHVHLRLANGCILGSPWDPPEQIPPSELNASEKELY